MFNSCQYTQLEIFAVSGEAAEKCCEIGNGSESVEKSKAAGTCKTAGNGKVIVKCRGSKAGEADWKAGDCKKANCGAAECKAANCEMTEYEAADCEVMEQQAGTSYYKKLCFPLKKDTEYEIIPVDAHVSFAYLSGNDNILDEGICYLSDESRVPGAADFRAVKGDALKEHYDTSYREQYHFVPFVNWINDPNGLCWYQGRYHMFYQQNPHSQQWNNMYWGHAVSRDLVHWTHLPIVFEPQEMILEHADRYIGGAFSGSAVVLEDEVLLYLTRHLAELPDETKVTETQCMTKSRDLLRFEAEKTVIDKSAAGQRPEGVSDDFRDPKLLKIGDTWYMVLGSALHGKAAILLYRSEDMEHWTYYAPLLIEETEGVRCFECPDFYELDGKYVAVGAWMCYVDEYGRKQPCRYYVGDWEYRQRNTGSKVSRTEEGASCENGFYEIQNSGWYDFGSSCYAMQSFEHDGRRICIGWISDFYEEHVKVKNGAYGSMTIPRELHVRENRLCMNPVSEIYSLQDELICLESQKEVSLSGIHGNSYLAKLELTGDSDFCLTLGRNGESFIELIREDGVTAIRTGENSRNGVRAEETIRTFPAVTKNVRYVEIFVDRRTVEVYLNHGEEAGTRLYYGSGKNGVFELKAERPEEFTRIEVWGMKGIW